MTKKKTMKNIKTPNKFGGGGVFNENFREGFSEAINLPDGSGFKDMFSAANIGKALGTALPGMAGTLGGVAGGLISGGFSTKVGQVLNGVGDAAMMFNPIIGGGIKALSGLINRGVGTKWNQEGLAKAEGQITNLNNFQSGASDYDTLVQDFTRIGSMNKPIKASDLGKDGWFVNRTTDKANELNTELGNAYNYAMRNVNNVADNIAGSTLSNLERNYAAFGGPLFAYGGQTHGSDFTNGLMFINNGGTHESNPYEGVPISMDQEGNPNLVEEGEVIWNDYVFSNRLKVPKSLQKKYKLGKKEMTFASAIDKLSKESEERPNDPISMRGLEDILMHMAIEQENIKSKKNINKKENKFLWGGLPTMQEMVGLDLSPYSYKGKTYNIPQPLLDIASRVDLNSIGNSTENNTTEPISNLPTWMRYAPVIGHGALALTDALGLTNKPDYTNANAVIKAANNVSNSNIKFNPIGDYLTYNPFDTEYYANQLRSVSGATRRQIMNTSGGNRAAAMAGVLAADNNTMNQMGDLYRKAAEYNLEQRHKVADFNRDTNKFNSEGIFRADAANQAARQAGLQALISGYTMKEQAKLMSDQAKAANISGLIQGLGDIGYENFNMNQVNWRNLKGVDGPGTETYLDDITGYGDWRARRQARREARQARRAGNNN